MKITKGAALLLFLVVITAGMAGAAAAETAQVYADTSSIGTADTGVTYMIPVNVSASGQLITGFTIDIPQLVDGSGNAYAEITPASKEKSATRVLIKPDNDFGDSDIGSYTWNPAEPNRVVWYTAGAGKVALTKVTTLFYLNVTVNGSMKYPGSIIPVDVTVTTWSVDGVVSSDVTNVTKYISVTYPASVPASVEITAPTGSLVYKAAGTASAKVYDQYGDEMTAGLTWTSSAPASLEFTNAATGAYHVKSCAAGSVDITATTSNSKYDTVTVTLTKADPAADDFVITGAGNYVYDGKTHNVTAAAKSGIEGMGQITVLYNGSETEPSALGTYPITLNVAAGTNYNASNGIATGKFLNITKAVPTAENLSYSLNPVNYDGTAKSVSVTAKPGVAGLGDITVKYNGSEVEPVSAGTYAVTVDIAEGTNYTSVNGLSLGNFVINRIGLQKDNFTVTPSLPAGAVYDGTNHPVTVTVKDGIYGNGTLTVLYDGAAAAPKNAKAYAVTVTAAAGQNYTATSSPIALGTFTITAKQMTDAGISITAGTSEFTYDGSAKTPGITVKDGAVTLVKGTDYTITNESAAGAGTYIVNVTGKGNYAGSNTSVSWTISRAAPTAADVTMKPAFTGGNYSIEYGTAFSGFTASSATIAAGSLTVLYDGAGAVPTEKGSYTVNVSVSGDANYTDGEFTVGTFTITGKKIQEPALTGYDKVYNGSAITAAIPESSYYTISGEKTETAVGTYTATVALNDKTNTTWSTGGVADLSIIWNITNATMTGVTVVQKGTLTYNGTAQTAAIITIATTVDGTAASFTYSTEEAGTYAAEVPAFTAANEYTVYYIASAANHSDAKGSFKVTIGKAALTADNFTVSPVLPNSTGYDMQEHPVTVTVKDGIYGNGTLTVLYDGAAAAPKNAKAYAVTVTAAAGQNYTATSSPIALGTFTITAKQMTDADISITAGTSEFTYDGTAKTPGITVKDGAVTLVKGTDYTITNESAAGAGTYVVNVTGKGNYAGSNTSVSWTISKATPTAADVTMTPAFTDGKYSIEYGTAFSGFTASSEKIARSSLSVNYNGSADVPTAKGSYIVNVSVSGDANYTDSEFTVGTFTITGKIIQAPALTGYDKVYTGSAITAAIPVNGNYTITGQTETAVGTYTATVALKDKVNTAWSTGGTDNLSIVWNITNATMTGVTVVQEGTLTYNGAAQTAAVTTAATTVDETIPSFTFSTEEAGTYAAAVPAFTAADEYTVYYIASAANHNDAKGSFTVTIDEKDISNAAVYLDGNTFLYNAAPQTVSIINVTVSAGWLLDTSDYEVSGDVTETAVGEYTVTVTGIGNYTGTASASWNITPKDISAAVVTLSKTSVKYTGSEQTVNVESVVLDAPYGTLSAADYTVSGDLAKVAVGEYSVTVTGIGNYTGTASASWNITKATLTKDDFVYTITPEIEYDGQPHAVSVTSTKITDGTITVTYNGLETAPTERGVYLVNVSVSGDSNYTDVSNLNLGQFEITMAVPKASDFSYTAPSNLVYNGAAKEASVTTENIELQGNFTVAYHQNGVDVSPVNPGMYEVVAVTQATENYVAANVTVGTFTIISKSSSGSRNDGYSVWVTATPTPVPTATPTPVPTQGVPTTQPVTSNTPAPATPAPFVGILAGLAAAAAVAVLRRK